MGKDQLSVSGINIYRVGLAVAVDWNKMLPFTNMEQKCFVIRGTSNGIYWLKGHQEGQKMKLNHN